MATSSAVRRRIIRPERGLSRAAASSRGAAANVTARTNVSASLDDREAAERFSAAVIEFSAGELARAARRTKAAAKGWKDASRAPGLSSTINMARNIPAVRKWLMHELGETAGFGSTEEVALALAIIQKNLKA